jgi:hypothetical protein
VTGRALLAAAALCALAAACGSSTPPAVTIGLRQPAALAVFRGKTLDDTATVKPYLAVANAARNDLTIIDATDDTAVSAPIQLRALTVPVAERPALLVSASLGDDAPAVAADDRPDLLVAVSAGDSVLQVVTTWDPSNTVFSDPTPAPPEAPLAVDLGFDVLALTAVPSPAGTARVAAALAGRRVALVEYGRGTDGASIVLVGSTVSAPLAFQPLALAAAPDGDPDPDGVLTAIYAATLDEIEPGVFGVAEILPDLILPDPGVTPVRALDARGPTRLVAVARLRERAPLSSAADASAFAGQTPVVRVYAVLDESGCGLDQRIDCGVVTLAPETGSIAADWMPPGAGQMPYRAPIPIPGRPLALAVAQPPAVPPSPDLPQYAGDGMRLYGGTNLMATTAVAAVASDDGKVYFLDLGRFKAVTGVSTLAGLGATVAAPTAVDVTTATGPVQRRLWLERDDGTFVPDLAAGAPDVAAAAGVVGRTPGWTRTASWTVTHQGVLGADLATRSAQAGLVGPSRWLALQVPYGTGLAEIVKVWHPAFGVRATGASGDGDIVEITTATIDGCASSATTLDARIDGLLAPTAEYPGGALLLGEEPAPAGATAEEIAARLDCFTKIGTTDTRVTVSLRARGLVLVSPTVGYAGRPVPGVRYELAYPAEGEDALVAPTACPLADWDGSYPLPPALLACDEVCRATCERAVLARKARRVHHNFESCDTPGSPADCATLFAGVTLPNAVGPALAFRVGVQEKADAATDWPVADTGADGVRALSLSFGTAGGDAPPISPTVTGSPYLASGAIAFDRSPVSAAAGYRFLVSYTADMVLDTSPQLNPPEAVVIR